MPRCINYTQIYAGLVSNFIMICLFYVSHFNDWLLLLYLIKVGYCNEACILAQLHVANIKHLIIF